mmetsp:Transcript_100754/g.285601  ORF Transcript_100754/g.285601 Transcript_100754/m.285601 type:complete len:202 (-) Transcript_100754:351-956(-)
MTERGPPGRVASATSHRSASQRTTAWRGTRSCQGGEHWTRKACSGAGPGSRCPSTTSRTPSSDTKESSTLRTGVSSPTSATRCIARSSACATGGSSRRTWTASGTASGTSSPHRSPSRPSCSMGSASSCTPRRRGRSLAEPSSRRFSSRRWPRRAAGASRCSRAPWRCPAATEALLGPPRSATSTVAQRSRGHMLAPPSGR